MVVLGLVAACGSAPAYLELPADELFAYAERAMEQEEWSEAIGALSRFVTAYPNDENVPEARLAMGHAYVRDGEELSGAAEFIRMLERFPGHARAPEAALGVCEAYAELSPIPQRDQAYTREAILNCDRLLRDYPQSPEAERGREIRHAMVEKLAQKVLDTGRYYFRNRFYDSAMLYFEQVVDEYPETAQAPQALLMLLRAYEEVEWEEEAEDTRDRLLRLYPDSEAARAVANAGPTAA
jgi:outer membrane protein assembly factor BamD